MIVWYSLVAFNVDDIGMRMLTGLQLTRSRLYEWNYGDERKITSFIRYIIRAAITSSPSTSPVKDQVKRDVNLAVFRDQSMGRQFDYGLGDMSLEDDEEMEVLDLPDIRFR